MLQSIDRAIKCDPEDPRLHNYIVRFLSKGENIIHIGALSCLKEHVSIDRLMKGVQALFCVYK